MKTAMRLIIAMFLLNMVSSFPLYAQTQTDPFASARVYIDEARDNLHAGRLSKAAVLFESGLKAAEKEGDKTSRSICLGNLGSLYGMMENIPKSIKYYEEGYRLAQSEGDKMLQLKFVSSLVKVYIEKGDLQQVRKWYAIQNKLPYHNDLYLHFICIMNSYGLKMLENDEASAFYYLDKARLFAEENNLGHGCTGEVNMALGELLYKKGKYREAIDAYSRGYDSIRKNGNVLQQSVAARALYVAYNKIDDRSKAGEFKKKYFMYNDSIFDPSYPSETPTEKLSNYEKRINDSGLGNINGNFALLIVAIIFLGLILFAVIMSRHLTKMRRINVEIAETLSSRTKGLQKKEKQVEKLGNIYNELQTRTAVPEKSIPGTAAAPILTPEQTAELIERINRVMEDSGIICSENFSLMALSKLVDSNPKYVSRAIHYTYGVIFKVYLNEYRIREACRRLLDKENYGNMTIKAIHEEVGFRTTAAFIAAFRKVTGMSPSAYKKKYIDNPDEAPELHSRPKPLAKGTPRQPAGNIPDDSADSTDTDNTDA